MEEASRKSLTAAPFNSAVEIGLRSLCLLTAAFPSAYSLQRLVVFDYLVVHSDDMPDGPPGLHPQTPHRGGEILVRRDTVQAGLTLYRSRGLVSELFRTDGVFFAATDRAAGFLDALSAAYLLALRERAEWVVERFGALDEGVLESDVRRQIGQWGAEFTLDSILRSEDV